MNIFREEGQSDSLSNFRIIGCMNFKFPAGCREGDFVNTFPDIFRVKIVINGNVNAFILVAQFPSLCVSPCFNIGIQRLGFGDLINGFKEVKGHDGFIGRSFLTKGWLTT